VSKLNRFCMLGVSNLGIFVGGGGYVAGGAALLLKLL
jgi:hypothetical protein